jgi:FAD/FMN-containing dehydrogenase
MADNFITVRENVRWKNHHENVKVPVSRVLTVLNEDADNPTYAGMRTTAARIQRIINDALAAGTRLRAVGSHWSFSNIPVVEDGWIIETNQLAWRFPISAAMVLPESRLGADELYFVQGGTLIARINEALERPNKIKKEPPRRRALRTSGASNGQTIAGALGTGVHGSAIDVAGMESQVAGIQLLTATRNYWIERASDPVMNAAFVAELDAELIRDDHLFEAAIVSLGSLGIVHSVMLKSARRYYLQSSQREIRYGRMKAVLNGLDFRGSGIFQEETRPYFFQAIIDPDDLFERGDRAKVFTLTRHRRDCPPDDEPAYNLAKEHSDGTDLPKLISKIIQLEPALRDLAVSVLMEIFLPEFDQTRKEQWQTPGQVYTFTEARRGVASSGFCVPIAQVTRTLELMARTFRNFNGAAVVLTCRYVQQSPGIMSFTRYAPSCVIDIDGVDSPDTQNLIRAVADDLEREGMVFTMHWGKTNSLNAQRVRAAFGSGVDRWNAARRILLPDRAERDLFSSPFIDAIGLNG